jgi:hypothetical protein
MSPDRYSGPRWSLDDIPYERLDRDLVRDDERLFCLTAASSFVEITSETYTRNLVEFCAGDDEVVDWLEQGWQHEEVQHGAALRRYVETAWPDFDWPSAYSSFVAEYDQYCKVELLAPTRALEMAARCVVETGTASFYRMLSDATGEPVLRRLTAFISRDEVDHYKHFYRFFLRYAEDERPSRAAIFRTLMQRTGNVDAEDAAIAFKHAWLGRAPGASYEPEDYAEFRRSVRGWGKNHYRFEMATKMVLKPLRLGGFGARIAVPLATAAARRFFFA